MEGGDAEGKGKGDRHMYAVADAQGLRGLYPALLYPEDIHADARGQRGHCAVGAGERSGRDADSEGEDDEGSQGSAADKHGQQTVAGFGENEPLPGGIGVEQDAQGKEEQVDGQDAKAIEAHVLLCGPQRAAGQVLLHHVLVEPVHHDGNEHAVDELPQEELRARRVPAKHPSHRTLGDGFGYAGGREAHSVRDGPDDAPGGKQHAEGLQGISADNVLDAAPPGVEEDGKQDYAYGEGEGQSERTDGHLVQDSTRQEEPCGSPREFAEQEEAGSGQVASASEALGQIAVDAGEPEPIVQRQQEIGDDNVAEEEAQAHLHVGHAVLMHPAGHADHAYAADAGAYHAEGDEQPRRPPPGTEECVVVALRLHKPGEEDKQEDVKP